MDKNILISRLEEIDADLVVLKGFPVFMIEEVGRVFPVLDPEVYREGKISFENINSQRMLQRLFTSTEKSVCCCESFISLCNNVSNISVLGKKVTVLVNNLLTLYPNQSDWDIPDFDSDEFEGSSNNPYSAYYSYGEHINGIAYVQYIDNYSEDNSDIKTIPFIFPKKVASLKNTPSQGYKMLSNRTIEDFLYSFYNRKVLDISPFYVLNTNDIDNSRLEVLLGVFDLLGYDVTLYSQPKIQSVVSRKELSEILKEIWGYDSFRTLQIYNDPAIDRTIRNIPQDEIIETVIRESEKVLLGNTNNEINNILLTAPTGAGKSILFQLSAIYLARQYGAMTIVISPLVALMDDQVEGLSGYDRVATLNSNRTGTEKTLIVEKIKNGEIDILYLSPEMFLSYSISTFIGTRRLGLIVIDEAHTVTTWGRDFRVDYLFLGDYIRKSRKILGYSFPIFALTATAVWDKTQKNDMVYDTIRSLNMNPCITYIGNVKRTNIGFVFKESDISTNYEQRRKLLTIKRIKEAIKDKKKTIVYFPFRRTIRDLLYSEEISDFQDQIASYHAALFQNQKSQNALDFKSGVKTVMLATKAYGMGIDVNDIEEVYHHAPSGNLSDYVQEIGRIARDPKIQGIARLDFSPNDFRYKRKLQGISNIRTYQLREVLKKLMSLYKMNGEKRNMLISTSDFSYIFPSSDVDGLEQNLKSSLLLISNDLLNKLQFHSLIIRPKSLYSKCYVSVPKSEEVDFFKAYRKYVRRDSQQSNIFFLNADELWQDRFSNISFPMFKRNLALGKVFEGFNVSLKTKISVSINQSLEETFYKIKEFFRLSEDFIGYMSSSHHRLEFEELKNKLPKSWDNESKERFLETFKSLYATPLSDGSATYCGIHNSSKNGMKQSFQFLQSGYDIVQTRYISGFIKNISDSKFTKFVDWNSEVYKICEFLNSLGLADYQRQGGEEPMVFVRINNPSYLNSLIRRKNYENAILNGIYEKQAYAERVFTYFFTKPMTDEERWEFIESYFLGVPEEELFK